jgi:hypothetical protein
MTWLLILALQAAPAKNPHGDRFTKGIGLPCAYCHDKSRPRAEDMYRAARDMNKMVDGLNDGPLKPIAKIDCVTCHRAGGRTGRGLHPDGFDRREVEKIVDAWPGPAAASEAVKREMARYQVSLGVACAYCHTPSNWKASDKPAMKTARGMAAMMDRFPKYFDFAKASAFTCFTCHQGAAKIPRG